jgi:hypothetical protein
MGVAARKGVDWEWRGGGRLWGGEILLEDDSGADEPDYSAARVRRWAGDRWFQATKSGEVEEMVSAWRCAARGVAGDG